jgi:hypothetical protein
MADKIYALEPASSLSESDITYLQGLIAAISDYNNIADMTVDEVLTGYWTLPSPHFQTIDGGGYVIHEVDIDFITGEMNSIGEDNGPADLPDGGMVQFPTLHIMVRDPGTGMVVHEVDQDFITGPENGIGHDNGPAQNTDIGPCYASMSFYEAASTLTIGENDQYYAVEGEFAESMVNNFTFTAGSIGSGNITNAGGTAININDVGHGLIDNDIVAVQSNNHEGSGYVTYIDDDNFTVPIAYVGDEACTWQQGDYLTNTGLTGAYLISVTFTIAAGAAGKEFKIEPVIETTDLDDGAFQITPGSAGKHQSSSGTTIANIELGDRIWVQLKNETDTTDVVLEHGAVTIHKI